ncbi:MAG: hypothetical protein COV52_00200 [Gammaproteobacteria bacterium CG11_big_fil_rev_8_21_14_0_20_46_22]|nr:MAG: hypothetical protein COW05_02510 [Gammaproteobacteria bacterium CG12_big_fil_rev_8_21_14_0_65_46_12]PIR12152.1 MAG: hypothetical protein COV52_00200 [Gammaproteobacteria bacterium CG11_big_fil_rev_8_21_14_0_20_46_22]
MLVDSHCHLELIAEHEQGEKVDEVLSKARAANVVCCLTVSTSLKTFPQIQAIAMAHPEVFCSMGVHPHNEFKEHYTVGELLTLGAQPKVVAIGETGLDFYYDNDDRAEQAKNFRAHIQVAKALDKPLIIHTRSAQEETLSIMREENASQCSGVMHCFTESWEMAKAALDLGFYISISGIVTFKKADNVREVARQVPLDRLLVETDSPFLAPVPHRGKVNQPAYVHEVAAFIAGLRGMPYESLVQQTGDNFFNLFKGASV